MVMSPPLGDPEGPGYANTIGVDPYIDWVLGPGQTYHLRPGRQQDRLAVLVRVSGISARDFSEGKGFADAGTQNARWKASIHVPLLYIEDSDDDGKGERTLPALITPDFLEMLQSQARLRKVVVRVTLSQPLDSASLPDTFP
jgi:hypothetical protein